MPAGESLAGVLHHCRGHRRLLGGGQPAGLPARPAGVAEFLDVQRRPRRRSRLDLVRAAAVGGGHHGRLGDRGGGDGGWLARPRPAAAVCPPPAPAGAGLIPDRRAVPAGEQGLFAAVHVVAAAVVGAGAAAVARLGGVLARRAGLLRGDLGSPGRGADLRRRG
ncbi:hypothetical protein SDC9_203998 [bioreactor metagenome]|uniref:Uncharacterized protein n=1 Tax=bioreactor metagenome TaxID=1076179 RepID=A0A645IZH8_9ZZZZ